MLMIGGWSLSEFKIDFRKEQLKSGAVGTANYFVFTLAKGKHLYYNDSC